MSSYPKNVQFTNLKINSNQDLFEINPAISNNDDDNINNCDDSCLPPLDLLPPCNNILAALKVNGSAAVCKGINIGNTEKEIKGTIRFNGMNFEGYNCDGWTRLDCCDKCKIYDYNNVRNEIINIGDIVAFSSNKSNINTVHKLLCEKWDFSMRISSENDDKNPKIVADNCGGAFVAGCTNSNIFPNFYNSDDTIESNNFMDENFTNKFIFIGKLNKFGCWEYNMVVNSTDDVLEPEIDIGNLGSLYLTGLQNAGNTIYFYNYDSNIGLELEISDFIRTIIGKTNGAGIWLWVAEIKYLYDTNIPRAKISSDLCDNLYIVSNIYENSQTIIYDINRNTYNLPLSTSKQILVALYLGNGNVNWIARVGGEQNQYGANTVVDGSGNAYVSGFGNKPVFYNKNNQINQTGILEDGDYLWVGKICFNGNWEWNVRITNINEIDNAIMANAIMANDIDCNLYIGFIANDTMVPEFYNANNNLSITGNYNEAVYIGKINSVGEWYWVANIISTTFTDIKINNIDVDGNGFIYVSGEAVGDLEFYNTNGTLGKTLTGFNTIKYIWLGKLNPYGNWDWAIQIYGDNDNYCPDISADNRGNLFLAGESDSTNNQITYLDPPNNEFGIKGNGSSTGQIIISKIINENQSSNIIGVIKEILEDNKVCVQFSGEITFDNQIFLPGSTYYYDCENEEIVMYCTKNSKLLRNIGIACNMNSLLWNPTGDFCVNNKKKCNKILIKNESDEKCLSLNKTFNKGDLYKTYTHSTQEFFKTAGSDLDDSGIAVSAIINGANDSVYVIGNINASATNLTDFVGNPITPVGDFDDIFVAKLDSNGNQVFFKTAGSNLDDSGLSASAVVNGSEDSVYLTGVIDPVNGNITDFNGVSIPPTTNSQDIFVAKLDSTGNQIFFKTAGSTFDERGLSISAIVNGTEDYAYITGFIDTSGANPKDFDGNPISPTGNMTDIFVAKLDSNGNQIFFKIAGTSSNIERGQSASAIVNGTDDYVYITGFIDKSGTDARDFDGNPITLIGTSVNDIFVAKLDSVGNQIYFKIAGSQAVNNFSNSLGNSVSGIVNGIKDCVYITGVIDTTNPVRDFNGNNIGGSGKQQDIFVSKLCCNYVAQGIVTANTNSDNITKILPNNKCIDGSILNLNPNTCYYWNGLKNKITSNKTSFFIGCTDNDNMLLLNFNNV